MNTCFALVILEPTHSSTYTPGQHISVRLDPHDIDDLTQAKFFWYREQEDMLKESARENLAGYFTRADDPPFGGKIIIPRTALGQLRLLAVGKKEGAQFGKDDWAIFDEVFLNIEPKAKLLRIEFETDKPLGFGRAALATVYADIDFLGTIVKLPVVGVFADGITRPIRTRTSGTTYHSSNEKVVVINPDGLLRLVGNGKATIRTKNRGKEATLDVIVDIKDDPNEPPEADAGKNQTVRAGKRVQLNALGSYDPEGGSLQYHWSQIGGSKVALLDPYSPKASFLAPLVEDIRTFRFKLRVADIQGADSFPVFMDIVVEP
ncbi:MAG: PKD domain-containing protein [Nitrospirales bacterium]